MRHQYQYTPEDLHYRCLNLVNLLVSSHPGKEINATHVLKSKQHVNVMVICIQRLAFLSVQTCFEKGSVASRENAIFIMNLYGIQITSLLW